MTHAQRLCANIVAAQCHDLGLAQVQVLDEGQVQARLGTRWFVFRWCVMSQSVVLVQTWDSVLPWELL